jgi:hypothetical protein
MQQFMQPMLMNNNIMPDTLTSFNNVIPEQQAEYLKDD